VEHLRNIIRKCRFKWNIWQMDHAEVPSGAKWITGSAGSSGANGSIWIKWNICANDQGSDQVVEMDHRKCRIKGTSGSSGANDHQEVRFRGTSGKWIIRKCRIKGKWIIWIKWKWIRVQDQAEHLAQDHQEAGSWKCRIGGSADYGTSNGWCKSSGSWIISFWVKWNIWVKAQMGQVDHQVFQVEHLGQVVQMGQVDHQVFQ
jgi:hypothetical protein